MNRIESSLNHNNSYSRNLTLIFSVCLLILNLINSVVLTKNYLSTTLCAFESTASFVMNFHFIKLIDLKKDLVRSIACFICKSNMIVIRYYYIIVSAACARN